MKIREATPEDIQNIHPAAHFEHMDIWVENMGMEEARPMLAQLARSIEIDGHVVGICGLSPANPGVAEIWFLLEDKDYEHPVAMAWAMQKLLPIAWNSMHFHRLQATVWKGSPVEERTIALLEHHDFKREGLLVNVIPGKKHWMCAKQCAGLQ